MFTTSTRAGFLGAGFAAAAAGLFGLESGSADMPSSNQQPTADEALNRLLEGNKRFAKDNAKNCNKNYNRLAETAKGQNPFAMVLGCADSRVSPEQIFDQRVGDLFVVRVAGNIIEPGGRGSLEYAYGHFGSPLLVVLGHQACGAVAATLDALKAGGAIPGHIGALVDAIKPAAESVAGKPGDAVENLIRANVAYVAGQLKANEYLLAPAIKAGKLRVVGMRYDLANGRVELI
jgi:carbonic anhydrase